MTTRESDHNELAAPRHRSIATVVGILVTLGGLALAFLSALGIDRLATRHVGQGILVLGLVVLVRWTIAQMLDMWFSRAGSRLRQYWRSTILAFFLVPRDGGSSPVQLADAIDTIVDEPRLAVVRASAQVSIVALVVIFATGGWQPVSIVLALLGVAVPLYQRAGSRAAALDVEYRERRTRLGERQLELLTHAPELRGLGAVHYGAQEIAALSVSEHRVALRAIRTALGSSLVTEFLAGVSVGLVAMDVGFGLLNGRLSLLRALTCVLVTSEFFLHVRRYGVEFHRREAIDAAGERLVIVPRTDALEAEVLATHELVTLAHPAPLSLLINPGDRVALSGASGVGKTTLAHTLLGWREPREGRVQRTTRAVAYVSADTALIEGTIGDNLRLGRDIPDTVVVELLNTLRLDSAHFEHLGARVSVDGEGFSSGERVRILLARAILHEPRLLILDDVAGLLDRAAREAVRTVLAQYPTMAIIEISVDEPLLIDAATKVHLV